ncbi:glycosyltransferase family 2 protein [Belnapia sp. T18]|uniref:Glycosyltransferase family 2 protein n=1 Tax=Belnapia arida TaxID=2804533 RepID=A0ABS1UCY4_9PROT|nr:glycosyltransferase family 2 protein [Belnapia arida]MBL6081547.1 glycosyltransferase family 2 protein [Belnapia arida]
MPLLPGRTLRRLWHGLWELLPASALPFRLRLGGLARRMLRQVPWLTRDELQDPNDPVSYRAWLARQGPAVAAPLPAGPVISLVMPAEGEAVVELRAAIEALHGQLYPGWELCLVTPEASSALVELAAGDPRIRLLPPGPAAGLGSGDWLATLPAADRLAPHALLAVAAELTAHPEAMLAYSDEDRIDAKGLRHSPWFKPDADAVLLLQQDLACRLGVVRRAALTQDDRLDQALATRLVAAHGPRCLRHLPQVLYHRRQAPGREPGWLPLTAAVPDPAPLVSVIIPTRDGAAMLEACTAGLLGRTDYPAIELLIVDNGSTALETFALFDRLRRDPRVRILAAPGPFNYSALNNRAAVEARGEVLLLLNNDIEVIGPGWLREMVGLLLRPGIGAVGAKLLYPNGTLQHGGVVIGQGGVAGHYLPQAAPGAAGHAGSLRLVREVSAATAACLAVRRAVFEAVGGLDAEALAVAFNDIDLCLRIREAGWRILWTPLAELYHHESATRGDDVTGAKARRFASEIAHMQRRWGETLRRDPFANPNLDYSHPIPVLSDALPRPRRHAAGPTAPAPADDKAG